MPIIIMYLFFFIFLKLSSSSFVNANTLYSNLPFLHKIATTLVSFWLPEDRSLNRTTARSMTAGTQLEVLLDGQLRHTSIMLRNLIIIKNIMSPSLSPSLPPSLPLSLSTHPPTPPSLSPSLPPSLSLSFSSSLPLSSTLLPSLPPSLYTSV